MSSQPGRRLRFTLDASTIAVIHTYLAFTAFSSALLIGTVLHYKKIVKNGVAGYPEEWFPSVSATIGDWYPERSIFQILVALNSGSKDCGHNVTAELWSSASSSRCGSWVWLGYVAGDINGKSIAAAELIQISFRLYGCYCLGCGVDFNADIMFLCFVG